MVKASRCGDRVMDATLILIDNDAELARARALVDRLWECQMSQPTSLGSRRKRV
jgi:hypothetical protein